MSLSSPGSKQPFDAWLNTVGLSQRVESQYRQSGEPARFTVTGERRPSAVRVLLPLERILQGLKKAHQGSLHPSSSNRKELGKDKSKSLFVLVVAAVVVLLFFLAVFAAE